jgi:hypothetical protein
MKLILFWLACVSVSQILATYLAILLTPFVLGIVFIGTPWLCWKRWKNPRFFDDLAR